MFLKWSFIAGIWDDFVDRNYSLNGIGNFGIFIGIKCLMLINTEEDSLSGSRRWYQQQTEIIFYQFVMDQPKIIFGFVLEHSHVWTGIIGNRNQNSHIGVLTMINGGEAQIHLKASGPPL